MDKRQPSRNAELGLSTRAIHHGYDPAEEHGALTPPIFMTSTYAFETAEAGSELFRGERAGRFGQCRDPGNVDDAQVRIGRRFEIDELDLVNGRYRQVERTLGQGRRFF